MGANPNANAKADQNGSPQRRRFGRAHAPMLLPVLAVALLTGCTRPTGDFNRAEPSVIHDTVMPAMGEQAARLRGDPVSKFNMTNDEKLLRDRAWALIRPPWVEDWIGGTIVELSRTRVLPELEGRVPVELYYTFLRTDKFRSSDARYDRIASDANGDAELVPPFCVIATRVRKADQERLRVLESKKLTTSELYDGAKARVWENRVTIRWVGQALRYRIKAYKTALDSLEIETPTGDRMWQVNTAIRKLEGQVRLAEKGCDAGGAVLSDEPVRRSRIYENWGTERPTTQK